MLDEPFGLALALTHRCDLRCRYCHGGAPRRGSMTSTTGRAAIRLAFAQAADAESTPGDLPGVVEVLFSGGEPLLEWRLLQHLTRYAQCLADRQRRFVQFGLTTNGMRLSDEVLAWLGARRFTLAVSVDGTPEMHDRNRVHFDGRGSSDVVLNRLRAALTFFPRLTAAMTVTPETAGALTEGVAFLYHLGVRHFEITPNYDAVWVDAAVDDLEEGLADLAVFYAEHFSELFISCLDEKIARSLPGGEGIRCGFGRTRLAVAPSGNIYPCERLIVVDRDPQWVIGTVERGLDPDRRRRCLVQQVNIDPACHECPDAGACRHACPCINLARTGRPGRPDRFICAYERMLIAAALAVIIRVTGTLTPRARAG
jgi:uncharacterized protein